MGNVVPQSCPFPLHFLQIGASLSFNNELFLKQKQLIKEKELENPLLLNKSESIT